MKIRSVWDNFYCVNLILLRLNILVKMQSGFGVTSENPVTFIRLNEKNDDRVCICQLMQKKYPVRRILWSKTSRKNAFAMIA